MKQKILEKFTLSLLFIVVPLLFVYSFLETLTLEIKNVVIEDTNIPNEFNNFKVAFLTDIHFNTSSFDKIETKRINKVISVLNELKPDLIILGGDYSSRNEYEIYQVFKLLKNINIPKYGIYGVRGNHDNNEYPDISFEQLKLANIKDINNEGFWIYKNNEKIKIIGVGDLKTDTQDSEKVLEDVENKDFTILTTHNPDYIEEIDGKYLSKIDLILSGHTHGGQITFFNKWAPITMSKYGQRYRYGLKKKEDTQIFISKGLGQTGIPLRFLAKPEIVVLELKSK